MKSNVKILKPDNFQLSNTEYLKKISQKQKEEKIIPLKSLITQVFNGNTSKQPKYLERVYNYSQNLINIENQKQVKQQYQRLQKEHEGNQSDPEVEKFSQEEYSEDEIDQEYQLHLDLVELIKNETQLGELSTKEWVDYWNIVAKKKKYKFEFQNLETYVQNLLLEKNKEEQKKQQFKQDIKKLENIILDEEEFSHQESPLKKKVQKKQKINFNEVYDIDKENHQHQTKFKENFKKNLGTFLQDKNFYLNDEKQDKITQINNQVNNIYSDNLHIQREQVQHQEQEDYFFLDNIENELQSNFPFKEDQFINSNKQKSLLQQLKSQNNKVFYENDEYQSGSDFSEESGELDDYVGNQNLVSLKRRSQTFNILKQHNFKDDGQDKDDKKNNQDKSKQQQKNDQETKIRIKQKSSEPQQKGQNQNQK